jgi:hypothetical protein
MGEGRFLMKIKRPVLAFRLHEDLYEALRGAAEKRKISISEEAMRRLAISLVVDQELRFYDKQDENWASGIGEGKDDEYWRVHQAASSVFARIGAHPSREIATRVLAIRSRAAAKV